MKDYQIVQRDENDMAKVHFEGTLPTDAPKDVKVFARVVGEEDSLIIVQYQSCKITDRYWEIDMVLPAGGLYCFEAKMTIFEGEDPISARTIKRICHFGVGDVYLLTGQSNMSGSGRGVSYDPPTLGVHLYANSGKWNIATHPLNDSTDSIYPENYEPSSGNSPGLSFGRTLKEKLNIPIGLVQASLGGSSLSMWHPEEEGSLYRGMMRRMEVVVK